MRQPWWRKLRNPHDKTYHSRLRTGFRLLVEELEVRLVPSFNATLPDFNTQSSSAPLANWFTPSQIKHAYGIDQINGDGTGQTIGIIDATDDPNIISDLHSFDTQFNLPDPTFTKVNQLGTVLGGFSDFNSPVSISGASESGTTATLTANNTFAAGEQVTITGITPNAYVSIDNAALSGSTVTVNVPNSFVVGDSVTITGITTTDPNPNDYDGIRCITAATSTSFSYTEGPGLGTPSFSNARATLNGFDGIFIISSVDTGHNPSQWFTYTTAPRLGTGTPASATATLYGAVPISGVSNSGTTVTISANNTFATGSHAIIAGLSPGGYDGVFVVTSVTATSFTYNVPSVLGSPSAASSAAAALYGPETITAASASGSTVTITAVNNFIAGQFVAINGVAPGIYDGTF